MAKPQPDADRRPRACYRQYAGMGLQLVGTALIGAALGYWLDDRRGHGQTYTLTGALVGSALGLGAVVTAYLRSTRR